MAKPSWISLSGSSGSQKGSADVIAAPNMTKNVRSGSLTVKTSSGLTGAVSLNQQGRSNIRIIVAADDGYVIDLTF